MNQIVFPFEIKNGGVKTSENAVEQKIKRVINYSVTDIPYDVGIGSGVTDLIYQVKTSAPAMLRNLRPKINDALLEIEEIEKTNIVMFQRDNKLIINVEYKVYEEIDTNSIIQEIDL